MPTSRAVFSQLSWKCVLIRSWIASRLSPARGLIHKGIRLVKLYLASMRVCKYTGMQVCKYASMQVCRYASMQVCKYASMRACVPPCVRKVSLRVELSRVGDRREYRPYPRLAPARSLEGHRVVRVRKGEGRVGGPTLPVATLDGEGDSIRGREARGRIVARQKGGDSALVGVSGHVAIYKLWP